MPPTHCLATIRSGIVMSLHGLSRRPLAAALRVQLKQIGSSRTRPDIIVAAAAQGPNAAPEPPRTPVAAAAERGSRTGGVWSNTDVLKSSICSSGWPCQGAGLPARLPKPALLSRSSVSRRSSLLAPATHGLTGPWLGPSVIKAQALGSSRARGQFANGSLRGRVQRVRDPEQAASVAAKMLGQRLRTRDSYDEIHGAEALYVAEQVEFDESWYLAMTIDRENFAPAVVMSRQGGSNVGMVARNHPGNIFTFNFRLSDGITTDLVSAISSKLGLRSVETNNLARILRSMYDIFSQRDATLLEINPLALSSDGSLSCLGTCFSFDNSAAHRQRDIFSLRDRAQEVADEVEAEKYGLCYVKLHGNIGNVVNGAGLAMATNDAIGFHGGTNSNFLDAGGKATKETMLQAFRIITRDPSVKAILVNIYGGGSRSPLRRGGMQLHC